MDLALEILGLATGLACVWLLIRQNVLTFPIGLAYAVITVIIMTDKKLYADVLLNAYYVVINAYGWWYWTRGHLTDGQTEGELRVSWTPTATRWILLLVSIGGIAAMSWALSHTDAQLVGWDSTTTVLSFAAMWMTARKYVENWVVWWFVDVMQVGIYVYKGIYTYALLYAVYLAMAVWGWQAWRASMASPATLGGQAAR